MGGVTDGTAFNEYYYRHCCGHPYERNERWLRFFGDIADRIVADINPRRVLDAGCAIGLLVETLRARGVEAEGLDLSPWAIQHATEAARPFVREGSIADPFGAKYDLIVCIEVLEHVPSAEADLAIANIAQHTDDVLFSSTPLDRREPTHINVRMPEEWAEAFGRHNLYRDVDFDASFVTDWAVRFTRRNVPTHRLVRDFERRFWQVRAGERDSRAYSLEIQERLAAVEAERNALVLRAQDLSASVAESQAACAAARTDAEGLRRQLDTAHATIRSMESSVFWRMRGALNRMLGRRR